MSTKITITDEAVEASTRAVLESSGGVNSKPLWRHEAKWFAEVALQAALPHLKVEP